MPLRRSLNRRQQGEPSSSSAVNGSEHGKVRAKSRHGPSGTTGEMDGTTEGENEMGDMLAQRQAQLEAVVDKHDTLVRPYLELLSNTLTSTRSEKSFIWSSSR